jgi:hypothetical protein
MDSQAGNLILMITIHGRSPCQYWMHTYAAQWAFDQAMEQSAEKPVCTVNQYSL